MSEEIEMRVTRRVHKMDLIRMPEIVEQIAKLGVMRIVNEIPNQICKNAGRFVRKTDGAPFDRLFQDGDVFLEVAAILVPRGEYLEMSRAAGAAMHREAVMHDEIRELRRKLGDAKVRRQKMRRRGRR